MPPLSLAPNTHIRLRFTVPRNKRVGFRVEAEDPVETYVFDGDGLREFYHDGLTDSSVGGFSRPRRIHDQEITVPFRGHGYLVILNPTDHHVGINYDLFTD